MNLGAITIHDPVTYRTATQNAGQHQLDAQLSIEAGSQDGHTIHLDPNPTPASRQIAVTHFGDSIEQAHGLSIRNFAFPNMNDQAVGQGLTTRVIRQTLTRTARIQEGIHSIQRATAQIDQLSQGAFIDAGDLARINTPIGNPQFNLYQFVRSAHRVAETASHAAIVNNTANHDTAVVLVRNLRVLEGNITSITNETRHPGLQGNTLAQHQDMISRREVPTNLLNTAHSIVNPNDNTSSDSDG